MKLYKVIDDVAWWKVNFNLDPEDRFIIEIDEDNPDNCGIRYKDGTYILPTETSDYQGPAHVKDWSTHVIMKEFEVSHDEFNNKLDSLLGEE